MADIIITEFMDEGAVDRLREKAETIYDPTLVDKPDELMALVGDAKAVIVRNRTQMRGDLLTACANLQAVGRLGVGLDNIDVAASEAKGAKVFPATGANDQSVAEYVITAAMMLFRGAYLGSAEVADGVWPRQGQIGFEISGKTLGLIGCGAIARETVTRAQALGMNVIGFDPHVPENDAIWQSIGRRDWGAFLAEADVFSLHVPLVESTQHMLNAEAYAKMKQGAMVINAARGGVLDENALAASIRDGHLGGAALDVFETEPLTKEAGVKFTGLNNVILTAHIAGVTEQSNVRVSHLIADKIIEHLGL